MSNCGCQGGLIKPQTAVVPPKKVEGIMTKKTCPKCSYVMTLIIHPSTNEKNFQCQNTMCKFSMPYSQPQQSPLV